MSEDLTLLKNKGLFFDPVRVGAKGNGTLRGQGAKNLAPQEVLQMAHELPVEFMAGPYANCNVAI